MSDVSHYLVVALCSFLAYPVVYGKVAPYLLKKLVFQRYASLDKAKQKFAHMMYDSPTVRYISALLLGYTTGESVVNIVVVGRSGVSWFTFVVHHVITCYATLVTCVYPSLPAFANFAVATEFSTIWLNIRLLLKEFGIPQSSTVNKVNNLAFFLSFSYVRVWLLIFDFYIPLTSLLLTKEFYTIELPVVVASVCASQFYLFINLYWYGLMCRMIPKVISGSKKDD
ncbi:TLC domain-containing protein 4-B-like isoform X2 [Branchiostoma lanceolatum]|uniref:TLC domain-containing protein 4-B-like isoform X2 n=1 Tax=Branchiostoma lanceolatum TaxID=7740 RepID=UPI0034560957